jgi:hypothetical protein
LRLAGTIRNPLRKSDEKGSNKEAILTLGGGGGGRARGDVGYICKTQLYKKDARDKNSAFQPTTAIVAGKGGQEKKPDELSSGP